MRTVPSQWTATAVTQMTNLLRAGRLSRRDALRLAGGAGLATAGLLTLGRRGAGAQDSGTPPAMATPQIGQQADGSTIWRVKVADMKMDQKPIVEFHGFFP